MDFVLFTIFFILAYFLFKKMIALFDSSDERLIVKYDIYVLTAFLISIVLTAIFGIRAFGPIIAAFFPKI